MAINGPPNLSINSTLHGWLYYLRSPYELPNNSANIHSTHFVCFRPVRPFLESSDCVIGNRDAAIPSKAHGRTPKKGCLLIKSLARILAI